MGSSARGRRCNDTRRVPAPSGPQRPSGGHAVRSPGHKQARPRPEASGPIGGGPDFRLAECGTDRTYPSVVLVDHVTVRIHRVPPHVGASISSHHRCSRLATTILGPLTRLSSMASLRNPTLGAFRKPSHRCHRPRAARLPSDRVEQMALPNSRDLGTSECGSRRRPGWTYWPAAPCRR
jgi:hypothetical protein